MHVILCSFNDVGEVLDIPKALAAISSHGGVPVVVQVHWGEEYATTPTLRQKKLALKFINSGADLIIGHHPHVVQEMEIINNVPVIFSLGNFIFDQTTPEATKVGLSVGATLTNAQLELSLLPFWTNNGAPKQMLETERRVWLKSSTLGFQSKATAIPGKYIFDFEE